MGFRCTDNTFVFLACDDLSIKCHNDFQIISVLEVLSILLCAHSLKDYTAVFC